MAVVSAWLTASIKWGLALVVTVGTAVIAYEAATIPFLRGAGLAQAGVQVAAWLFLMYIRSYGLHAVRV